MKERLLNVIKIFLMILGVLFLVQILIVSGIVAGFNNFTKLDNLNFIKPNEAKIKTIQPLINYIENYQDKNGKYPEKIETKEVKIKPDLYFEYKPNKDLNCYSLVVKSKKNNSTKQYQHCSIIMDNSTSETRSYIEYNK